MTALDTRQVLAHEEQHPARGPPMGHPPGDALGLQPLLGHTRGLGGLDQVKDIVKARGGRGHKADVAGELKREVLLADPDAAAILGNDVVALIEVVHLTAGAAPGLRESGDGLGTHAADKHLCHAILVAQRGAVRRRAGERTPAAARPPARPRGR